MTTEQSAVRLYEVSTEQTAGIVRSLGMREQEIKANLLSSAMRVNSIADRRTRLKQTNRLERAKSDRLLIFIWNILYYSQALMLCSL